MKPSGWFNDATTRIRWCLVVINAVQVCVGIVEIALGCTLRYHLQHSAQQEVPQLWMIGVPGLVISAFGIAALLHGERATIVTWLVLSTLLLPLSFLLFNFSGCFNTAIFWVHLQVYGQCTSHPSVCQCFWEIEDTPAFHTGSCDDIQYATSLYLSVIGLLIINLVLELVVLGLGFIMTLFINYCLPKDLRRPLYTSISTNNGLEASNFYKSSVKTETPNAVKCNMLAVPLVEIEGNSTGSERQLLP